MTKRPIKIIEYFKNNKTLCFAIGSTIAMFLYTIFILGPSSSCFSLEVGSNSLGLSFSYTKEMVLSFFGSRTEDQLICYGQFLKIWDPIFAFVYTLMHSFWIMYFFRNKRLFLIIPLLVMFADWIENYIELLMLKSYSNSSLIAESMVSLGSLINSIKLSLSAITYLLILFGVIIVLKTLLIRHVGSKKSSESYRDNKK